MAKVKNSLIGQLSGRVGGFVFTSNKSGATVRAGTIPTNPRTQVQTRQRTLFGAVSRIFRSISGANRTLWQEFADNYFNPKNGSNTGQFSGYNAFTALRNVVQQAYRLPNSATITVDAVALATPTVVPFTPMPDAPIPKSFTAAFKDENDQPQGLIITSATVKQDGTGDFTLQVGDGQGVALDGLISPEGYAFGYALYISNGNPASNLSYGNRFANCLGYIKPTTALTPLTELDDVKSVKVAFTTPYDYAQARRFPIAGEYALLTVFAVNKYGQLAEIDNRECLLVAV
jgi:hypothetical protein